MYIELVALKLEIYLTKLEKKRMRSKAETAEAEARLRVCCATGMERL
jgi:hypothetical protein